MARRTADPDFDTEAEYERLRIEEDKLVLAAQNLPGPATETKPARVKKEAFVPVVETKGRKVVACNLCPKLCVSRSRIVNGYGPVGARFAIIAESPGEVEDENGRPLIGPAGQTLRGWLERVGVNPDNDVYYDNSIKCHPEGNRKPSVKEMKNCSDHLWRALEEIQPDIIIACGNYAIQALLPEAVAAEGITRVRGHIFWNERLQRKIIPMFHPSAALHDFSVEPFCIADLRKALNESKNPTKKPETKLGDYKFLLDVDEVERVCSEMETADILVFDTETTHTRTVECSRVPAKGLNTGLDWRTAEVLCLSFTDKVNMGYVVPFIGQNFRDIWSPEDLKRVKTAVANMMSSDVPKVAHNGKFDIHMLREHGFRVSEFVIDTMLMHGFIDELSSHALEPLRSMYTGMPFYDEIVYEQTDGKRHMEWANEEDLWTYAAADTDCTLRIAKELNKLLDKEGDQVRWLFEEVAMPLQAALTKVEERGVLIDMDLANRVIEETDKLIAENEVAFFSALPEKYHDVSLTSPQQIKKLFYIELGLPKPPNLTDSGKSCRTCQDAQKGRSRQRRQHWNHTSTDKDAIKEMLDAHPCIPPYQTITQLTTLKKTFLLGTDDTKQSGLLHNIREDGRIHTAFNVGFVETGRLSCSPNIQNIPNEQDERPELFKYIRKLFVAPPGRKLAEVDFSQVELRILAYLSGQKDMIAEFEANRDFHLYTARHTLYPKLDPQLDDSAWKSVHKDKRTAAKRVNFGIPYGLTAFGMSQWLHCSEEEAQEHIDSYMAIFDMVAAYFKKSDRDVLRRHIRRNALGRARHFHGIETMKHFRGYRRVLRHMLREAYNFPIQSTAADVLSLATIAVFNDPWYEEHDTFVVMSVHDSLMLEGPDEYIVEAAQRTLKHFEETGRKHLNYYLPGEANGGQRWSDWEWEIGLDGEIKYKKEFIPAA